MCCCGWLYGYQLLFDVQQRSGVVWLVILLTVTVWGSTEEWCVVVVGYIVNSYCLRFNRGVVCVLVVGYIVNCYCWRLNEGVACDVVVDYIVNYFCLRVNRGGVCVVVVGYIVNSYCLRFNRGVVCCCGWLYC